MLHKPFCSKCYKMKNKLTIVKIGGKIIEDETSLHSFLENFALLEGPKILVHGGGQKATEISRDLGIETRLIEGRRVTNSENLDIVIMVYAGLINKKITALLQSNSCDSIGLSGADMNCIVSNKRPTVPLDFGWVGDIVHINTSAIRLLLEQNITPVFCALTHDGKGQLLNTNADTIAAEIAIGMSNTYETKLIYCFDNQGVLQDVNDKNSIITHIDTNEYAALKANKTIQQGMLPKMENAFNALNNHVAKVIIGDIRVIDDKIHSQYTSLTL